MFGSILRPVPQPPRPPTPERVDQPFHIVGLFRAAASGILADGGTGSRARLAACASASRSSPSRSPPAIKRRFELRRLGAKVYLHRLGAVELAAGTVLAVCLDTGSMPSPVRRRDRDIGCPPLPREQERALARFLQALREAPGRMRSSAGEDPRHRNATVAPAAT
jgi:hypothetical protein